MEDILNLEKLERKAWLSTFSDGLWDLYLGWLLLGLGIPPLLAPTGISRGWSYVVTLAMMALGMVGLWLGKRYLTVPRLGRVEFSEKRANRRRYLGWMIGGILILTLLLWFGPRLGTAGLAASAGGETLLVVTVWVVFIGAAFAAIGYQFDYPRIYFIGFLYALTVPLDELITLVTGLDLSSLAFVLPGLLILILGARSLRQFVSKYPGTGGAGAMDHG